MLKEVEEVKNLGPGEMKEIEANGISLLLVNYQENFYAVSNRCTHLGCKLSKGTLEDNIITCPCHGSKFDITNGKLIEWISRWPKLISLLTKNLGLARSLSAYRVVKKGPKVYIEI